MAKRRKKNHYYQGTAYYVRPRRRQYTYVSRSAKRARHDTVLRGGKYVRIHTFTPTPFGAVAPQSRVMLRSEYCRRVRERRRRDYFAFALSPRGPGLGKKLNSIKHDNRFTVKC
jgi:hypothetical protein